MVLSGPRTYTLVKVMADDGTYGIAEAYGSPTIGTKAEILELKPLLVGKDPLEIDALYTSMGEGGKSLSGTRTDGSAHNPDARRERYRDGLVGSCRKTPRPARDHAAWRKVPRQGSRLRS